MRLPSKRKIATTANPSTDTIRCVLNPSGLWPSTRNLNSSPNYFQHSIFSTALLLSVVSPDNSFDLITDRDEFPSHNVRPGIIRPLCIYGGPASTVADLWSVEKPSFRPGRLKILLKIPNCFFSLIFHAAFPFPLCAFEFRPLWHRAYRSFNIYCWINDQRARKTLKHRRERQNCLHTCNMSFRGCLVPGLSVSLNLIVSKGTLLNKPCQAAIWCCILCPNTATRRRSCSWRATNSSIPSNYWLGGFCLIHHVRDLDEKR